MKTTFTKLAENRFSAVTDRMMTDGKCQADFCMRLDRGILRSHEEPGSIRVGGLLKFNLGPKSFAAISALSIGQSVTL